MVKPSPVADPGKRFAGLLERLAYGRSRWQAFEDFVTMASMAMAQTAGFDPAVEETYLKIVGKYPKEEAQAFPELLGCVVDGLERETCDFLGKTFMELELGNDRMGQFFTPYEVSRFMAEAVVDGDQLRREIDRKGFVSLLEPACGAGGMVLAFAEAMRHQGINPQERLFVRAVDLDPVAARMCHVQMSLAGLSGVVSRGNSLTQQMFESWNTPFLRFNWWRFRERPATEEAKPEPVVPPRALEPMILPKPDFQVEENGQLMFNF